MSTPEPPQYPNQQANPYQVAPAPVAAPVATPAKGLSIAAMILAFLLPLIGLILGIIAMVQSKKAGQKNGLALASVIIAAVLTIVGIISSILIIGSMAAFGGIAIEAVQACQNGAAGVEIAGQTVSCEDILSSATAE